jgi:hypothetical protein
MGTVDGADAPFRKRTVLSTDVAVVVEREVVCG